MTIKRGFYECCALHDTLVQWLLVKHAIENGAKVDYGGGHVVYEFEFRGAKVEIAACDRGEGQKVWIDNYEVAVLRPS